VIDVPALKATDHCYDKRTVDCRNAFRKFSDFGSPDDKFIVRSDKTEVPPSAQVIFDRLLSGNDHGDLLRAFSDFQNHTEQISSSIGKGFDALKAINLEITKARKKITALGQLSAARQALQEQLSEISKFSEIQKLQRKITS
jgi:hypothetical protein